MWIVLALMLFGQARETVADIQVHGNLVTSDDDVRRLTGVQVGAAVEDSTFEDVAARLKASGRFERVQVLKRYASIADPSKVVVVVIVDEGRVKISHTGDPEHPYRAVRNRWPRLMYQPILGRDDRYGSTYGVRIAVPQVLGDDSRLMVPFAWGGEKQAGLEFDKTNATGLVNRVRGGADWSRRTHPVFEEQDDRREVWVRGEHWFRPQLRAAVTAGVQRDTFGGDTDAFGRFGADFVVDTRVDPQLPRNAVYGRAAWTHLAGGAVSELDGRAYVGVIGQLVLGVRAQRTAADASLPVYLKPIFGGAANVRGFSAGTEVGNTLTATSTELILPLTSPLHLLRMGVSGFVDAGAVDDQPWRRGYGGSIWFTAAMFHLNIAVAHGEGSSTRVHVGGNVSF